MEKRFLKDYAFEADAGENRLVYSGVHYQWNMEPAALRPIKRRFAALAPAAVILYAAMAWVGGQSTRAWPVGVPFTLTVLPLVAYCYEASRFFRLPPVMERRHYEGPFLHIGVNAGFLFVLALTQCATGVWWLLTTPGANRAEYFFPFLSAALAAAMFIGLRAWGRLHKRVTKD